MTESVHRFLVSLAAGAREVVEDEPDLEDLLEVAQLYARALRPHLPVSPLERRPANLPLLHGLVRTTGWAWMNDRQNAWCNLPTSTLRFFARLARKNGHSWEQAEEELRHRVGLRWILRDFGFWPMPSPYVKRHR